MTYVLNIGLANLPVEAGLPPGSCVNYVAIQLREHGLNPVASKVVISDSEPTLVVHVESGYSYVPAAVRIGHLSVALGQDCIAVVLPDGTGALIGPRHEAWGEFNPEFFFLLDGTRLSQVSNTP